VAIYSSTAHERVGKTSTSTNPIHITWQHQPNTHPIDRCFRWRHFYQLHRHHTR
jgi:hypothetical protein